MNNKRHFENLMVQEILQAASLSVVLFIGVFCFLFHNVEGQVLDTEKSLQTKTQNFKSLQIAYLTDASFSDAGWGAFAYNAGLELMSKYNHNVTLQDNVTIPDIEKTVRSYANKNFDIIITQGFEWGDPVLNVAKDYPDTKFIVFTGLVKSKNVASIFPKQQDAAFILGALATMLSKNQTIGFIGGDEKYPNLRNIYEGYRQGAQYINPKTKVLETYLQDWDNETKGRSAALSQISHGADILLHVADTSGKGVIDAAKEKGIYAFGAVSDQNKLAPDTVVTSFVLDPQKAYDSVFAMIHANNFTGDIFSPGLESFKNSTTEEGIVYIAPFHGFEEKIPAEIQTKLHEISRDIVNKKIIVAE